MLGELVGEAARRFGDRPAFVADAGWALSYAELDRASDEVAAGLARRGVGRGDAVALVLPAVPEYPVAYVAAAKLGAITAGVNTRLTAPERAAVLDVAQPALALATEELAPDGTTPAPTESVELATGPNEVLHSLRLPSGPAPGTAGAGDRRRDRPGASGPPAAGEVAPPPAAGDAVASPPGSMPPVPAVAGDDPSGLVSERGRRGTRAGDGSSQVVGQALPGPGEDDEPVALVFTSGTTGQPKAAVYGNRQLRAITAVDVGDGWGGGGPMLSATPPAHLGFMTKLPGHLRRGATLFLRLRWRAQDALRLAAEHRMPMVNGIPTQIALMLRQPDFDWYDLSAVRVVVMGGGPVTPALVREARRRFRAPVVNRYSSTEVGIGVGTTPDDPPEDAEETVGRPLLGVELALSAGPGAGADGEGRPELPGRPDQPDEPGMSGEVSESGSTGVTGVPGLPGEVGEVCLRSAGMMSGYWRDPEATAAAFTPNGFVRTGDLGWVDERGRLHLVGRTKEMYVRGGFNVYPVEVEAVLASHPAIAAVAVVPRSDPVMGEIGVAVVVVRSGSAPPSLDELRAHGAPRLARHKLPEALVVVDELPLTPMEKVDRRALTGRVAQMLEADRGS